MEDLCGLLWRILIAPLTAAVAIWLLCHRSKFYGEFGVIMEQTAAPWIAILFLVGSTWFAVRAYLWVSDGVGRAMWWYEFVSIGDLHVHINWSLDRLSVLMLLVVCIVSLCIFVYSIGYLHGDPGISRFYAKLSFFVFSMLGIVLSGNFVMMFIFWELVGVSSYMLIGYWYERPSAAEAAKKAFLVNRVGDFGFLVGILLIWGITKHVNFNGVAEWMKAHAGELSPDAVAWATVLIFCGAVAKSAQFPLHVWLPDAMEGPTPVSALIHAATMVAAGVYMLCRVSFLIFGSEAAMLVIAWTGGITACLAAVIATQQNDIKRILAYSTLSQLGYMIMAVGLSNPGGSGYMPAMFHLSTHAFFKALLFLSAGSVIIAFHHGEQDIWKMGGLWKKMPITTGCFAVGMLALCGFPGLSGFFSKEVILGLAYEGNGYLFTVATITAALTAFYMCRCFFVAFLGEPRTPEAEKAQESSGIVFGPLVALAFLSVIGGYSWLGIPHWLVGEKGLSSEHASVLVIFLGLAAFAVGLFLAAVFYRRGPATDPIKTRVPFLHKILWNKFYFDELYLALVKHVQGGIAVLCDWVERRIIAGAGVRGAAGVVRGTGQALRLFQTGDAQTYALLLVLGLTIILYFVLR